MSSKDTKLGVVKDWKFKKKKRTLKNINANLLLENATDSVRLCGRVEGLAMRSTYKKFKKSSILKRKRIQKNTTGDLLPENATNSVKSSGLRAGAATATPWSSKSSEKSGFLLPPRKWTSNKTVVLDMDETLVHARLEPLRHHDYSLKGYWGGKPVRLNISKRPGLDEFLSELCKLNFEIVVFTTAIKEYAEIILNKLDPLKTIFTYRLFRDSCSTRPVEYVKDLKLLGRDLKTVVIVDDNPVSYLLQRENGVPVKPYVDDRNDRELFDLINFFKVASQYADMREAVLKFKQKRLD